MKIYTKDSKSINNEINKLIKCLQTTKNQNDLIVIFYNLNSLISEYINLTGTDANKYISTIKRNKLKYLKTNIAINKISDITMDNFIKYKNFHRDFSLMISDTIKDRLIYFDEYPYSDTDLSEEDQYEIIRDFF